MTEKSTFDAFTAFQGKPHVTAAMIGISRRDWIACQADTSPQAALEEMRRYRFDVLPIQSKDAQGKTQVVGYYRTAEIGNFDSLPVRCAGLDLADCLGSQTELMELLQCLIAAHKQGQTPFFFLATSKGPIEIVGLVSDINLNSRPVYQYGYAMMGQLEMELSDLIGAAFPDEMYLRRALDSLATHNTPAGREIVRNLGHFELDKSGGRENGLREYLSLRGLLHVLHETGLYSWLGYPVEPVSMVEGKPGKDEFTRKSAGIYNVRNRIAHPVHSYRIKQGLERPQLLAAELYTAFSAAELMLRKLKELRKNTDSRNDRMRVGQVFTSEFLSDTGAAVELPGWASGLRLEPGCPADLPAAVDSLGFISLDKPLPDFPELQGDTAALRLNELVTAGGWEAASAIGQARRDTMFKTVQKAQQAHNLFREKGVWLTNITREQLCELGWEMGQESVVHAVRGELSQLLLCAPPKKATQSVIQSAKR